MRIIVDKRRQLNYHPLVVYVILMSPQYQKLATSIESLNNRTILTRGLFKFRAIKRGNEYSSDLSSELTATISRFNVILRLVDDSEGNYNYALGKLNLNQSPALLESELEGFVINSCKQNIKILKGQLEKWTESAKDRATISALIQGFNDAVSGQIMKARVPLSVKLANVDSLLESDLDMLMSSVDSNACSLPPDIVMKRESLYGVLPNRQAKNLFNDIMKFFESRMDVVDIEESDKYAQGTVDESKSEDLKIDLYSRHKYGDRPDITIKVTRILPNLQKRVRRVWGVEITVGDVTTPIYLGGAEPSMVYICTLLKQKMGTRLSREVFKRMHLDQRLRSYRHSDIFWVERVYSKLYPHPRKKFDDWYKSLRNNSWHAISQGKGAANRAIKSGLKHILGALYYCKLHDDQGPNETCYYVDVPSENIQLPPEFEELIQVE